jgi:hypothetical protein
MIKEIPEQLKHEPEKLRELMERFKEIEMKNKEKSGGKGYDASFDSIVPKELLPEDLDVFGRFLDNKLTEKELSDYDKSLAGASESRKAFKAWLANWFMLYGRGYKKEEKE